MLFSSYIHIGVVLLAGVSSVISAPILEIGEGALAERGTEAYSYLLPRDELDMLEERGLGDKVKAIGKTVAKPFKAAGKAIAKPFVAAKMKIKGIPKARPAATRTDIERREFDMLEDLDERDLGFDMMEDLEERGLDFDLEDLEERGLDFDMEDLEERGLGDKVKAVASKAKDKVKSAALAVKMKVKGIPKAKPAAKRFPIDRRGEFILETEEAR